MAEKQLKSIEFPGLEGDKYIIPEYAGKKNSEAQTAEIFNDYEYNSAEGPYAHAEGQSTHACGHSSHTEGNYTLALGNYSHAEGGLTWALGECSHTEGSFNVATGANQHVQGRFNIPDVEYNVDGKMIDENGNVVTDVTEAKPKNTYAHIVGGGWKDSLNNITYKNIHTIDWEGNAEFTGDVKSKGNKLATEEFVNNIIDPIEAKIGDSPVATQISSAINNNTVGKKTVAGGEIFNDYGQNKALSKMAKADGYSCTAGVCGYKILEVIDASEIVDNQTIYSYKITVDDNKDSIQDKARDAYPKNTTICFIGKESHYNALQIADFDIDSEGRSIILVKSINNQKLNNVAKSDSTNPINNWIYYALERKELREKGEPVQQMGACAGGHSSFAVGVGSYAQGYNVQAIGSSACALGSQTKAIGAGCHANGINTTATVHGAYAEGYNTTASGYSPHAEGGETLATGAYSHVEGYGTIARGSYSHVQGQYNIEDYAGKYAHIVGGGYKDNSHVIIRQNIHTIDWGGNAWFAGVVYSGNNKLATLNDIGGQPLIESDEYPGCYYRMVDNEKEWLNPPNIVPTESGPGVGIGTEYRTLERYNGSPVYMKQINFGALPSSGQSSVSNIGTSGTKVVRLIGNILGTGRYEGLKYELPIFKSTGMVRAYALVNNKGSLIVTTTSDETEFNGYFTVYYVK